MNDGALQACEAHNRSAPIWWSTVLRVGIVKSGPFQPMVGDLDDHRPNTTWRLAVDPGTAGDEAGLAVLMERCASGDRIPLHRHDVDEVVMVVAGVGEYHLAGETQHVEGGDVGRVLRFV